MTPPPLTACDLCAGYCATHDREWQIAQAAAPESEIDVEGTPVERGVSQTTRLSSAPSTPTLREALEPVEECLLRECGHDYKQDCLDDFRAALAATPPGEGEG